MCGVTRRGPGWAVAAHFSSPDMVARENCSIRGATRRRHAVTGLLVLPNPHLRCLVGRWVRLGEARAVSGGCGGFGRFSRFYLGSSGGCNGGNCSIRGATRRRHAVRGLLVLPNPHLRHLVGRWVRLGEARVVSGGCGAFGRFSSFYLGSSGGCNGGNCSIRGATRRRHAVRGLLVLPNPHARGWRGGVGGGGAYSGSW